MGNKTLGRTFLENFQQQTQPQQPQIQPQQPLSNKTGLSPVKKTALQQGVIASIAQGMKATAEG